MQAMNNEQLQTLLENVRRGVTSPEEALKKLQAISTETLDGYARLDHHRAIRTGIPEVIFAQGKEPDQVAEIFLRLSETSDQILATRLVPEMYLQIENRLPAAARYNPATRLLVWDRNPILPRKCGILVLTAGTSDIPVAEEAALTAELMGNEVERIFDVGVAGIHRLFEHLPALKKARVLIVAAGMEGALPSVVAGLVSAPVIALPTSIGYGASFHGLSALLSMLNACAPGIAVVNIDNGFGAGCMAARINRMEHENRA